MKKYVVVFLGLVLFFGTAGLAFAQEEGEFFYKDQEIAGRFNLGVRGGAVLSYKSKADYVFRFTNGAQRIWLERKNGWFAGGELTYDLGDYLAVGVEGYYQEYKVDTTRAFQGVNGNLGISRSGMAFGKFILKYAFDMEEYMFVPYIAGAPGGIFPDFKESDTAKNNNVTVEPQNGFAAKYSGGFDFYITDNVAINAEGAFLMADVKTGITIPGGGTPENDIKNDAWVAGGGLKYKF